MIAATHAPSLPETCFLFAYFHHPGHCGLRLAWSRDGFCWESLGRNRIFLQPTIGEEGLMRDPFLFSGPDGTFHLLWTTGWRGQSIGYASSIDLISWSAQRELPVMAHEPDTKNCWAPEAIWDEEQGQFLIFWSSTVLGRFPDTAFSNNSPERNHRIYATSTRDFHTFTPTRLHYDGGFNVIDATLARDTDGWLMFVKNETVQPQTEKNIRMIRAQTPHGPFSDCSPPLTGDYWAEGPSALRVGDEWRVYFDKHQDNRYGLVRSRDLRHWEDVSDRVCFPNDARHGSFLTVPSPVIERLWAETWP